MKSSSHYNTLDSAFQSFANNFNTTINVLDKRVLSDEKEKLFCENQLKNSKKECHAFTPEFNQIKLYLKESEIICKACCTQLKTSKNKKTIEKLLNSEHEIDVSNYCCENFKYISDQRKKVDELITFLSLEIEITKDELENKYSIGSHKNLTENEAKRKFKTFKSHLDKAKEKFEKADKLFFNLVNEKEIMLKKRINLKKKIKELSENISQNNNLIPKLKNILSARQSTYSSIRSDIGYLRNYENELDILIRDVNSLESKKSSAQSEYNYYDNELRSAYNDLEKVEREYKGAWSSICNAVDTVWTGFWNFITRPFRSSDSEYKTEKKKKMDAIKERISNIESNRNKARRNLDYANSNCESEKNNLQSKRNQINSKTSSLEYQIRNFVNTLSGDLQLLK